MTDIKKLRRAALQPARVFGRRDFDPNGAEPLLHFHLEGQDYWSPGFPTWMVLDGDCRVLERAIQQYGYREAPVNGGWLEFGRRLMDPTAGRFIDTLDEDLAEDYELSSGVIVPCYASRRLGIVPATPVVYAQRRWTDDELVYRYDGEYLRVVVNGAVGVIVRRLRPGHAKLWQTGNAA